MVIGFVVRYVPRPIVFVIRYVYQPILDSFTRYVRLLVVSIRRVGVSVAWVCGRVSDVSRFS